MNNYICHACTQTLVTSLAPSQAQEIKCGSCRRGFFIPLTDVEVNRASLQEEIYAAMQSAGIDPDTVKVDSFSFGIPEGSGRRVAAHSWTGVAEKLS